MDYTDIKLHSGKVTNRRLENPAFLVVFTRKDGDVPARDVSLQEGIYIYIDIIHTYFPDFCR